MRSRVTDRDRQLLAWVGRWRHSTARQVHTWLGLRPQVNPSGRQPSQRMTYRVLQRLTHDELLIHHRPAAGPGVYAASADGLSAAGMHAWRPSRWNWLRHRHEVAVIEAALKALANGAERVIGDREMKHLKRLTAASDPGDFGWAVPIWSQEGGRIDHWPDLWVLEAHGRRIAVEVELSRKASSRLDRILHGYRRLAARGGVDQLAYLSSDPAVREAVAAAAAAEGLAVRGRKDAGRDLPVVHIPTNWKAPL